MSSEIWTFAELDQGNLSEASQETLAEGKKIATKLGGTLCSVLLGHNVDFVVDALASFGAQKVYLADSPILQIYAPDTFVSVLANAIIAFCPGMVLIGNTSLGRDLAATLAGRLRIGLASDCTFINVDTSNDIQVVRPVFGGKAAATIEYSCDKPWLATLRTGLVSVGRPLAGRVAEIVKLDVDSLGGQARTKSLGIVKGDLARIDLTEADVIVAGGRGVGRAENFRLIEELAEALGGKVGGSRYAVDAGWIPREKQIGQTGKVVAPSLYIACGISGAVHHVTGMRDSKTIIAVNKDRTAPIFKVADLGIVGDLMEVIPAMIGCLRSKRSAVVSR